MFLISTLKLMSCLSKPDSIVVCEQLHALKAYQTAGADCFGTVATVYNFT